MEGGYFPWKNQKIENACPPIEYFSKSLPPPPSDHFWERDLEGEWKLVKLSVNQNEVGKTVFTQPSIVEHTVMPTDTLQGLCLQYHASALDIRRMNMFSGSNIQFKTRLLIPLNAGVTITPQVETEEVILQKFKNLTHEHTREARIYLEEHNWHLDNAFAAWKNDTQWEENELRHPHPGQGQFSAEINDVVAPLAIEEVPLVTAFAVSYTEPTNDQLTTFELVPERRNKSSNKSPSLLRSFLLRPLLRK